MPAYPTTTKLGIRYLGNSHKKEVHDLRNEKVQCQINEILQKRHAVTFSPDHIAEAHICGYDNCAYCIGGSLR